MRDRKGRTRFAIVAIGSAALLGALGAGCEPLVSAKPAAAAAPARSSAGADATPDAAERRIVIDNFTFNPRSLVVAPGTRVTWVNRDDVPHTATSTEAPRRFDSGAIDTDDSFSFTFAEKGAHPYFCAIHPHMTGEVIVK